MRFSICTLGCKSNQYESQAMAKLLLQQGHEEVAQGEETDAFIINTCSVTAVSDKKSRQTIRSVRKQNPRALVAVCGCYAQLEPEDIRSLSVNLVGGTGNHLDFVEKLSSLWAEQSQEDCPTYLLPTDSPLSRGEIEPLPSGGLEGRTRALLKIQDGCQHFCSYCIIPYARGKCRSLSPEDSALAIHELIGEGYQEIVLTGIEISSWGKDLPQGETLLDFLEMANGISQGYGESEGKEVHFRLGSLEPRTITPEFCEKVSKMPYIRPHFHLSLQSGSDGVLKRMNRKYDSGRFLESVSLLRNSFQNPAITTDLIVGFPQETPEEFQETMAFVAQCQFSSMHIFPYSPREGTPAAKMSGQITKEVKDARGKEVKALAEEMKQAYQAQFMGETLSVLFETALTGEAWLGHSPQHLSVVVQSPSPLQNQQRQVKILGNGPRGLLGELV